MVSYPARQHPSGGYPISGYLMKYTYTAQVIDLPGHLGSLRAPIVCAEET